MRLKVTLHEDLGAALMDGVVLCHLANHVRPRSVASIHVPSPAVVSTDRGILVCIELLVKGASGVSGRLTAWTSSIGPHTRRTEQSRESEEAAFSPKGDYFQTSMRKAEKSKLWIDMPG